LVSEIATPLFEATSVGHATERAESMKQGS
jgi:hypothetical protein